MKNFLLLLVVTIFLLMPKPVSAHMVGQPPFFKINGVFTLLYPVPTSSVPDFLLPQDIADKNFLVNDPLEMDMEISQLPILPEIIDQTTFLWEFGDGEKGEGLKNTHRYKKPGSYFLTVQAKYRTDEPQLIQSTLIHILPDHNYQLPQAKIIVNGKVSNDPLTDPIAVNFKNSIHLDATSSLAQGNNLEFYWDLGDGKFRKEKEVDYNYDADSMQVFPVLRVKDQNGFIGDAYVELTDEQSIGDSNQQNGMLASLVSWPLIGIGVVILLGVGGVGLMKSRIKK
jgi:hypothetical protein